MILAAAQDATEVAAQTHVPALAWVLAAYVLMLAVFATYLVCVLWPSSAQLAEEQELIRLPGREVTITRETRILLLVLAMGLIGGCAYVLWTLADNVVYLGATDPSYHARAFKEVQAVWYVLPPWTSCMITLIFYGLIRSGLFMVAHFSNGKEINVYGIAGLSGAAGFFSGRAYDHLSRLVELIHH